MWKKFVSILICLTISCALFAQTPPDQPAPGKQPPSATKNPPLTTSPAPKSVESQKKEQATQVISVKMKEAFAKKQVSSRGITYIYPPYITGYVQKWTDGTGFIHIAQVQMDKYNRPTGYTFQSGSSYSYGMSSSRCWVSFNYTPSQSGYYEIGISAYQEGSLRVACGYNGEVYAYRNLGIMVDGLGYQAQTLSDLYFNSPTPERSSSCGGWNSVRKEFYLQAGRSYNLSAYTEVGGWSTGDNQTYQITNVSSALGPFMIQQIAK